jgi:NAD(P)H dehydrogenase (quinone)
MSSTSGPIGVTGATGFVGGAVARQLADSGQPVRMLVRDPARAPVLPGAEAVACSYADGPGSIAALTGIRTLLMVSASESADRLEQHRTFVDAAQAAGVQHIVYTSFVSAAPDATFTLARDHAATEDLIRATGCDATFLRDNLYLDFFDAMVGADGVIRGPAAEGRVAAVSRADIARTATAVLRDVGAHRNRTYQLTGPEALTLADVARILSVARGTEVVYHDETVPEAYESRRSWGAPDWLVDAWVSTYTAIAHGEMARVSEDITAVTGRPPLGLAEWLAQQPAPGSHSGA